MSIVKFTCETLSGALNNCKNGGEIRVGKDVKAKVVMDGYIGAGRVKNGDDFAPSAFGRLPLQAALVGEGDKSRLVLEVAGGLRGVLFANKNKEEAKDPDYTGNLEVGDEEFGLFGRKVKTENGTFISLSSTTASSKASRGNRHGGNGGKSSGQHADPSYGSSYSDDDIPFANTLRKTY